MFFEKNKYLKISIFLILIRVIVYNYIRYIYGSKYMSILTATILNVTSKIDAFFGYSGVLKENKKIQKLTPWINHNSGNYRNIFEGDAGKVDRMSDTIRKNSQWEPVKITRNTWITDATTTAVTGTWNTRNISAQFQRISPKKVTKRRWGWITHRWDTYTHTSAHVTSLLTKSYLIPS